MSEVVRKVKIFCLSYGRRERAVAGQHAFDRDLFDELVHYIAWRMRDDDHFGRTKVAKTMFYADFTSYAEDGEPLTGARYYHWPQGPFTVELYRTEERLVDQGLATLKQPDFEGDEAKLRAGTFAPRRSTPFHRAFLDIKMDEVVQQGSARAVSEFSHEHPGWLVTEEGQEIPYAAVHVSREGPTQADIETANQVARFNGWI
jgi:uncharacterized phage-associated protein